GRGAGAEIDGHRAARVAVVVQRVDAAAAIDRARADVADAAGRHVEGVVARAAEHRVVAGARVEVVAGLVAGENVRAVVSVQLHLRATRRAQVLETRAESPIAR